jgi:hypothetical protein
MDTHIIIFYLINYDSSNIIKTIIWNINLTDQLNVGYVYGIDAEKEELKNIIYELEEEIDKKPQNEKTKITFTNN